MLFVVKFLLSSVFFFGTAALAEETKFDLSWVKALNREAEKLSQSSQIEVKAIVDQALHSSTQQKQCKVAEIFSRQAEQITRKNLDIHPDEENTRYSKLVVFVSFSMPLETLKNLAAQVNQVGGNVILRGLINNSFKETAAKVKDLKQEVMIDPTVFEEYQIKGTPTFILRKHPSVRGTESIPQDERYDQLSGNVSLEYALNQFATLGTRKSEAHELLKALRTKP